MKTQVHENKNATSEMIYSHCGPCLLLSASLPSSAWKKSIMMQLSLLQWGQSLYKITNFFIQPLHEIFSNQSISMWQG